MATPRRKFTDEEKLDILQQAKLIGVTTVLRKYNLSYSVYSKWKDKFLQKNSGATEKQKKAEMMSLLEENKRLKRIVADQALSIEQKVEELKRIRNHQDRK